MVKKDHMRSRSGVLICLVGGLMLAACGGGGATTGDGSGETTETIRVVASPSGTPALVAADQGLFEGINVETTIVGADQTNALFLSGDYDITYAAPLDVAELSSQGEDLRYFSTAGATNMINGIAIRAEDADKYQSLEDLVGKKLGNPGFGTGTWATFQVIAQSEFGINARKDFNNVTASPGALLGLLESGEVEAALLFSGQTAAVESLDQFELIFSFTESWQEAYGQPLVITGAVATPTWLKENPEEAAAFVEGVDAAVQWVKEHPEAFAKGGMYEDWAESEGWLGTDAAYEGVMTLMQNDEFYLTSETYEQEWVDSMYQLVELGKGVLVEQVPPKNEIFFPPGELQPSR